MNTKDRLERAVRALAVVERRRSETGDTKLGAGLERFIVRRELRELEQEILENPGPLEVFLVRRK